MLHRLSRILMNEADASPGGGSTSSTPATPDPQAQGQSSGEALTVDAVKALLGELKNSVEANTRRMIEGALGKKTKGNDQRQTENPKAETASTAPDPRKLRLFDRATAKLGLSEKAIERMERAFEAENPDDVGQWVADYAADLGLHAVQDGAAAANSNTNTNSNTATNVQTKPPPSAAPGAAVPTDRPQDVTRWDDAMIRNYVARQGGNPADLGDPRNSKIWKEVLEMYQTAGAQKRIVPNPKR